MSAWGTVQYVGSAFSLTAFVAAAVFYAYRERSRARTEIIKSAPPAARLDAIAATAEFFQVNVAGLPATQQADIVLEQLRIRSRRDLLYFFSFAVLAVVCGGIVLTTILVEPVRSDSGKAKLACSDKPARYPETETTRVVAFSYRAADPGNVHVSNWSRPTDDRWVEKTDEGESLFAVSKRIDYGLCDGTIVSKIGEPNLQLLISDKNCSTRGLLFRRLPVCEWAGLPKMQDVR